MKNANFRRPIRRKLSLILAVAALIVAFAVAWRFSPLMSGETLLATWNWLMSDRQGYSGTTFRNMLWAVGLILGLILATWRVKVSNWQAQTAERSHRESRFEKGADMLGSDKLPNRVFGVAALSRLAADYPNEYHNACVGVLCTFILLSDSADESGESRSKALKCRPDIQSAAQQIGIRREALGKNLQEIEGEFRVDLRNAVFAAAELEGANFSSAWLDHANLSNAILNGANFSATSLEYADLSGAQLENAEFSKSRLTEANLSGADLNGANHPEQNWSEQISPRFLWRVRNCQMQHCFP